MTRPSRAALLVAAAGLLTGGAPLLLGPPGGDDAYYHAMRAQQHARCWLAGVPFPRWYPDLNAGLGGPEPRAYPVVPLAVHAALAVLSGDGVRATSLATVIIPPLAGLLMLWAARRRGAQEGAALVAALAWTAAPYLILSLHERVALAEGWALAVLPAVLAVLLPPAPERRHVAAAALLFGVLAATQVPLAFMTGVLIAGAHLAARTWAAGARAAAALAAGLAVAAVSWLPNLDAVASLAGERLVSGEYAWTAHLFPFRAMPDGVLAVHLGAALAGVTLATGVLAVRGRGATRLAAWLALAAVLLVTPLAAWAYRRVPGFEFLQFPWRWLGPASCLACLALAAEGRRWLRGVAAAALLAPLLLGMAWRWRLPDGMPLRPRDSGPVVAQAATRYGVPPILPSLPSYLPRGAGLAVPLGRVAAVRAAVGAPVEAGPRRWKWRLAGEPSGTVTFPLLAAPGWEVAIDGEPGSWRPVDGMVAVALAAGPHEVALGQVLSAADRSGAALSAIALIALAAWSRARRRAP